MLKLQTHDSKSLSSRIFIIALFWGSLWGITEATLGHVLHMLRIPGLAGFVMMPLGVFFMLKAFQTSGKPSGILLTSICAAGFKLSNLLFPGIDPAAAFNPALAILAESLAVFAVISFLQLRAPQRSAFCWLERR